MPNAYKHETECRLLSPEALSKHAGLAVFSIGLGTGVALCNEDDQVYFQLLPARLALNRPAGFGYGSRASDVTA